VATRNQVTEPATPVDTVTEPAIPEEVEGREYDPRKFVYVYNTDTGKKLDRPVPETWLDGRFPHLSLTPSKKAGK
jgi:hypothetical protein